MSQGPVCRVWADAACGSASATPASVSTVAARAASFPTGKRLIARPLLTQRRLCGSRSRDVRTRLPALAPPTPALDAPGVDRGARLALTICRCQESLSIVGHCADGDVIDNTVARHTSRPT